MLYRVLTDAVVIVHVSFVLFALAGGVLVFRRKRLAWVHLPAVFWAALVEINGWVCPLTPLENWLRERSGTPGYRSGFIAHYFLPLLYPEALTRRLQVVAAAVVLVVNIGIYLWVLRGCFRDSRAGDR